MRRFVIRAELADHDAFAERTQGFPRQNRFLMEPLPTGNPAVAELVTAIVSTLPRQLCRLNIPAHLRGNRLFRFALDFQTKLLEENPVPAGHVDCYFFRSRGNVGEDVQVVIVLITAAPFRSMNDFRPFAFARSGNKRSLENRLAVRLDFYIGGGGNLPDFQAQGRAFREVPDDGQRLFGFVVDAVFIWRIERSVGVP